MDGLALGFPAVHESTTLQRLDGRSSEQLCVAAMDATVCDRVLTIEMVKSVGSCDQLDETETPIVKSRVKRAKTAYAHKKATHPKSGPQQMGVRGQGVPKESAALLTETFFPDDQVDTDDPFHMEVRRRTDGDCLPPMASEDLPGMDLPFTSAEIKDALKGFHPRKVPDINGFISVIC
ncbi:hypothetical protein EVAR_85631_1 [Eumeta japonica]|uniref:Uncharacterized protein n=1 Tax=Eumeta variegata TaxID=151549 RepID=A0A4C1XWG3_EUMVA|nr:hypothetical protein EVAR_85631_1 [Eumeta japonica]